jgi:hypothetical protein
MYWKAKMLLRLIKHNTIKTYDGDKTAFKNSALDGGK